MSAPQAAPRIRTLDQLLDEQVMIGLVGESFLWGTLHTYEWGDNDIPTMLVIRADPSDDMNQGETLFIPWHAVAFLRRSRTGEVGR
jgi:hypothetical protein